MQTDEQKKQLRALMLQKRADMSASERAASDRAIWERLRAHPFYRAAKTVLAYASMPHEVSTAALLTGCLADGKTVGLPVCETATRGMTFYRLDALRELTEGAYRIPVPPQEPARVLCPDADTLMVVPMLAFDSMGYRLGAGGGYYDRFLAKHPQLRAVGICYAQCRIPALPRDAYDQRLTHCITQFNTEEYHG